MIKIIIYILFIIFTAIAMWLCFIAMIVADVDKRG